MRKLHGEAVLKEVVVQSSSVTWERVAELVKTRNGKQCRMKWLYTGFGGEVRQKRNHTKTLEKWTDQHDLDLLHKLCQENAEDEDEIDWLGLSRDCDGVRSPHHLRSKWACLRRRVPGYALKSFEGED